MESTTKVNLAEHNIHELVRHAFGQTTRVQSILELTEGWYNTAYAITLADGQKTVLKVSPPPDAAILSYEKDIMRTEVAVMRLLESDPHIPVPHISAADFSRTLIPNDYFFMDYLHGNVWNDIQRSLSPEQNATISQQLGEMTRHINGYHHKTFGYYAREPKFETWLDAFHDMLSMLFFDAQRYAIGLPITAGEVKAKLHTCRHHFAEVTTAQLVHWDLWQGNVFVQFKNKRPCITGVIDFERVYWGDPLGEAFFRGEGNPDFSAGYAHPMLLTESQRVRNLFYDLYLYVIMVVEDGPRQYSDRGVVAWARQKLDHTVEQLRSL